MISQGPWLLTLQIGVLSDMITASQELRTLHELQAVESRAFWNSFDLILHIDMLWYILDSHISWTVTTIFEIGNYYWLVLSSHKILWCQLPIHEKCQLFIEHLNHMNHHVTLHQCICRHYREWWADECCIFSICVTACLCREFIIVRGDSYIYLQDSTKHVKKCMMFQTELRKTTKHQRSRM